MNKLNRGIHMPDGIHEVPQRDVIAFETYAFHNLVTVVPMRVTRGGAYVRKGLLDAVIFINDDSNVVRVYSFGKTRDE